MIGLIFGEGNFPKEILKKIINKKKYLIIDLTQKKVFKGKNSYHCSVGQFGKIFKILKENKCKKILFAGRVLKPNISKLKLDLKGIYYFPRILKSSKIGEVALLKEIIHIFKKEKISTINSLTYTPYLTSKKGIYTKIKPNNYDLKNIRKGIFILKKSNSYSFSQAVVVYNDTAILEGKEGTNKLIKKIKKTKKRDGVLVKFPKKKQDLRIDLPTIGLDTLKQCNKAKLKGIVLKSKKHIFLDRKKSIIFANKKKMFIKIV